MNELFDTRNQVFTDADVNLLLQTGNRKGNASRNAGRSPSTEPSVMADFIFQKYDMTRRPTRTNSQAGGGRKRASSSPNRGKIPAMRRRDDSEPHAFLNPEKIIGDIDFNSQVDSL